MLFLWNLSKLIAYNSTFLNKYLIVKINFHLILNQNIIKNKCWFIILFVISMY